MIEKFNILYPSILMAVLTVTMILALGARRLAAVRKRTVAIKYYQTYNEGEGEGETGSLRQHARHVQNHFEVPPLFHLAVLLTFVLGAVTPLAAGAAWFFVVSRILHSAIHLTYNNVTHRFLVYGSGLLAVLFLWVRLLVTLAG